MTGVVLGCTDLLVAYAGRPVARLPELDVRAGEVVALVGPNGSGKSSLLRALALMERPAAGRVILGGSPVPDGRRARERLRRRVTLALPRPHLFRGTVRSNLERALAAHGVPSRERPARVTPALERLGLGSLAERDARTLSSGETARVSLARALVLRTEVLLLDEPFAHVDPDARVPLRDAVAERIDAGVAVVVAALGPDDLGGLDARVVPLSAPQPR